jgi:hypothetical protein
MENEMIDRDIAILLTGAISRQVNMLADVPAAILPAHSRRTLKSIRASLKIAISYGLSTSQTELLSSYLQVIVMSEGEKFIKEAAQSVGFSLRSNTGGGNVRVVESSERLIEKWVFRELKAGQIAAVSEFVANAVQVFNHDHLIKSIATKSTTTVTAIKRTAFQSDPVLINSLPIDYGEWCRIQFR